MPVQLERDLNIKDSMSENIQYVSFCNGDEPKSGRARDLGDRLQSRNVPLGTSGDLIIQKRFRIKSETKAS